uniref:Uncharacterized protein n=1 Tax=Panagrolaimus superbus TaxID=310955 RepID=A0A914YU21_9BILA
MHLTNIGRKFNAYFGSNRTYIANDSNGPIRVTITGTEFNISEIEASGNREGGSGRIKIDRRKVEGWTLIQPGRTAEFIRNGDPDYLTVACNFEGSDEGELLIKNVALPANISYIIDDGGYARQKYGSHDLFERA